MIRAIILAILTFTLISTAFIPHGHSSVLDEAINQAIEEASPDKIKAYTACLIEAETNQEEVNCVNEELGDIYN